MDRSSLGFRAFESELLEIYIQFPTQEERVVALETFLSVSEAEGRYFLIAYDLDGWFLARLDEVAAHLAVLAPRFVEWRRALWAESNAFARTFPITAGSYIRFQKQYPEVQWADLLAGGTESTTAEDILLGLELLRPQVANDMDPKAWLSFHRGKLAHVYGAVVERLLLQGQPDIVPGAVVRVGGHRHADGWDLRSIGDHWELKGVVEIKASLLGYRRAQVQGIRFLERMIEEEGSITVFDVPLAADRLELRTKSGPLLLSELRREWRAAPPMTQVDRLRWIRTRFDDGFFRIRIPGDEPVSEAPPFGTLERVPFSRETLLRELHRWLVLLLPHLPERATLDLFAPGSSPLPPWLRYVTARGSVGTRSVWTRRLGDAKAEMFVSAEGALWDMDAWAIDHFGGGITKSGRSRDFFDWLAEMSGAEVQLPEFVLGNGTKAATEVPWRENTGASAFNGSAGPCNLLRGSWQTLLADWNRRNPGNAIPLEGLEHRDAWRLAVKNWGLLGKARARFLTNAVLFLHPSEGAFPAMNQWAITRWVGGLAVEMRALEFFQWLAEVTAFQGTLPESVPSGRGPAGAPVRWRAGIGGDALKVQDGPGRLLSEAWRVIVEDWNRRHGDRAIPEAGRFSRAGWEHALRTWELEDLGSAHRETMGLSDPDAQRFVAAAGVLPAMNAWAIAQGIGALSVAGNSRSFFEWLKDASGSVSALPESVEGVGDWRKRGVHWTQSIASNALRGEEGPARLLKASWDSLLADWNLRHPQQVLGASAGKYDATTWAETVQRWGLEKRVVAYRVARGLADPDAATFVSSEGGFRAMNSWAIENWGKGIGKGLATKDFFQWLASTLRLSDAVVPDEVPCGTRKARWSSGVGGHALKQLTNPSRLVTETWRRIVAAWNAANAAAKLEVEGGVFTATAWQAAIALWDLEAKARQNKIDRGLLYPDDARFAKEGLLAMHNWSKAHGPGPLSSMQGAERFFLWLRARMLLPHQEIYWSKRIGDQAFAGQAGAQRTLTSAWHDLVQEWNAANPSRALAGDIYSVPFWESARQTLGLDGPATCATAFVAP